MNNRVVIIGAGLGGLQCAFVLAKNGMEVTVLEQDRVVGGCLQSFQRGNTLFDTGFHYVGGLREGESLYPLFRYFNLLDLPWKALDEECFDEVVIGDERFSYAVGHERFIQTLSAAFPHEQAGIRAYTNLLREVGEHIYDALKPRQADNFYERSLFARSAHDFLCETIHDPLLRQVLSGTSLKMELNAPTLPLYPFAQINNSYIQSAWRLLGGGQQIADHLVSDIEQMGGIVRTSAAVSKIEENGQVRGVWVNGDEFIEADYVICDIHPQEAMRLMAECPSIRNIYRRRMLALADTIGIFTANIRLKPNVLPYENKNIFVHREDADLWNIRTGRTESVMVSFYPDQAAIDLLCPMHWSEVSQWADKPAGHRGEDYVAFKQHKTEECLALVEQRLPQLRGAIDHVYTSTPLTYQRHTRTNKGSAYGIRKDWRSLITTVFTPKTPVQNVLLTGQNLNLHGLLGVSMTSVITCAEILGLDTLSKQIIQ